MPGCEVPCCCILFFACLLLPPLSFSYCLELLWSAVIFCVTLEYVLGVRLGAGRRGKKRIRAHTPTQKKKWKRGARGTEKKKMSSTKRKREDGEQQTKIRERIRDALRLEGEVEICKPAITSASAVLGDFFTFSDKVSVCDYPTMRNTYDGVLPTMNSVVPCCVCNWACTRSIDRRDGAFHGASVRDEYAVAYYRSIPEQLIGAMHADCADLAIAWARVEDKTDDQEINAMLELTRDFMEDRVCKATQKPPEVVYIN